MSDNKRGEGYYMENGRKADSAIHDQIFAEANPEGVRQHTLESFRFMVNAGIDPQEAAQALGLEGGFDIGPGSLA